ncbi:adenylate/guanylate cyclase domain-containing protein [Phytohabitans sp. ZYX-F-186]|uniref:Adenylate/guanylate cyclase domain-containing protein n=1 Tax=Phytohabitans maris TaxID=3071409 RepID=A0ABU0ZYE8_9ACTN|nr:adenylate/guanylate cyclase domain-containing protein [Phytohabitans sp. ZYX-F-186]MDQ7911319.1 adenylate/guanylate cyclase domain-containing protein [Phytohabitans sp. ZYX-F-186]
MRCTTCAGALPEGARFCPTCGAPSGSVAGAGETRKVVTVVFCDLVGSTALSDRLDPETLRAITLRYFGLMSRCIEAHGGTVEKFIGDAVMAVFGVPVMHEDDARRGASAALDMVGALDTFNVDLEAAYGVRLAVRIGVNTGEVVASGDASVRQALVSGEVVNVAARLEQNAPPGAVLVGAQTRLAAGGSLDTEPVGPLVLKGKDAPVPAYRLLGVSPDDPELVRRFDLPFVGRAAELAGLRRIAADAAGGSGGRLVLVTGEAGLGKTRLVRQWQRTDEGGTRFGFGRCRAYRDQGTLAPLAEALGQLLEVESARAAVERDAAAALALLHSGLFVHGTPAPSVADTCAAVAAVVRRLAASHPVAIAVDDCHWADPLLLEVLTWLAGSMVESPVVVACLTRPEILDRWTGWERRSDVDRITLGPLAAEHAAALAAELVEAGRPEATAEALRRAEGNPFLLEQLLAVLAECGPPDGLPLTVQGLLAARIDALPPRERAVLDLAAVVGRDFDLETLTRLADPDAGAPVPLAGLSRRRLVERTGGRATTAYRFRGLLTHEVTYHALPKRVRADVHERLAEVLDASGATAAVIGGHLERSYRNRADLGVRDEPTRRRAADLLAAAGADAQRRADLSWAEDLLGRAAELATPGEPAWLAAAQRLGEVRAARGRTADGADLLRRVLATATATGDPKAAAHARLQLATLDPGPAMAQPARVARESIATFRAAGDDLGLARAHLRIAQEKQFLGRHGEAQRLLDIALDHGERGGADPERAAALGAVGISLWLGPIPAERGIERCSALLARYGDTGGVVRLALNCPLAVLLSLRRRIDDAYACLHAAEEIARDLDYAEAASVLPIFTAQVQVAAGRLDDAAGSLRRAVDAGRADGDDPLLAGAVRDLARVLLRAGDVAGAAGLLDPAGAELAPSDAADVYGLRARLAAHAGDRGLALRLASRAAAEAARTDSPVVRGTAALDLAETYRSLGLPERGARAAGEAHRLFAEKGHLVGMDWADAVRPPEQGREQVRV